MCSKPLYTTDGSRRDEGGGGVMAIATLLYLNPFEKSVSVPVYNLRKVIHV